MDCSLVRMSRSLAAIRHSSDEGNPAGVTEFRSSLQKTNDERNNVKATHPWEHRETFVDGLEKESDRWTSTSGLPNDSRKSGRICGRWPIGCSVRQPKRTTPFRRPGYDSAAPAQVASRISEP